jgi:perosamine synthetase
MSRADDHRLAIFGGAPIRSGGPIDRTVNRPDIHAALEQAYRDGDWHRYHGRNTEQLKTSLAEFHTVEHVELCCSGTAALEIALKGVNVKPGDEVLVSGYDFKGIVSSVLAVGAVPVVVDVELDAMTPSLAALSDAATDRTKIVVVSHLHGNAARMDSIAEWAQTNGFSVLEDACQSPGAMVSGRRAGTWGDVGILSFGGSKLLTAGRGGAILTSDLRIAQRIRLHGERGNQAFPLSELQAAVLLPQLNSLDDDNRRRAEAVDWLRGRLHEWGLKSTACLRKDVRPAFYKLGLLPLGDRWGVVSRAAIAAAFRAEGIAIDEGFSPVSSLFARSRYRSAGNLVVSSMLGERLLVLHHPVLSAEKGELELVVDAVRKVAHAIDCGEFKDSPSP